MENLLTELKLVCTGKPVTETTKLYLDEKSNFHLYTDLSDKYNLDSCEELDLLFLDPITGKEIASTNSESVIKVSKDELPMLLRYLPKGESSSIVVMCRYSLKGKSCLTLVNVLTCVINKLHRDTGKSHLEIFKTLYNE
jgi:hypothetical protein